jgi:superoxide dismutase, Cu-Zn family
MVKENIMKILFLVLFYSVVAWSQGGPPTKAETMIKPGAEATTEDQTTSINKPAPGSDAAVTSKKPFESVADKARNVPDRTFKKLDQMMATAELKPTVGQTAQGKIDLVQQKGSTKLIGKIEGLTPNSIHAIHIHEFGDCSAPDASSAGSHFNPNKAPHGALGKTKYAHLGDLGNISADEKGVATIERTVPEMSVNKGKSQVLGRSIILHEKEDDLKTQPAGDSGGRLACGVITKLSHPEVPDMGQPPMKQ